MALSVLEYTSPPGRRAPDRRIVPVDCFNQPLLLPRAGREQGGEADLQGVVVALGGEALTARRLARRALGLGQQQLRRRRRRR